MKKLGAVIAVATVLSLCTNPAAARGWRGGYGGHHWRGGWGWGGSITLGFGPWWGYPDYYYPYAYSYPYAYAYAYAYPYTYAYPYAAPAPAAPPSVWYYCRSKKGYYPYVSSCPQGWEQVPTQPAR